MSEESRSISLSKYSSDIQDPLINSGVNEKLLKTLIDSFDEIKLINSGDIEKLEEIKFKYSRPDISLVERIDDILIKVKCRQHDITFKGRHSCGQLICYECIKNNQYICYNCNEQISHEMIRKFFNISLSCINCGGESKSQCRHYCESCILLNPKDFYSSNECCANYYYQQINKTVNCHYCTNKTIVSESFEFCKDHFLCNSCSQNFVETGKCSCGDFLSIDKVEFIYEKTHFLCENCKYYFKNNDLRTSKCCKANFCNFCMNLACNFCNIQTLLNFPSHSFPPNFR